MNRLYPPTHGHTRGGRQSPTYVSWISMWSRIRDQNHPHWKYYGGRGITICDRWKQFESFLADMGERSPGTSLDRMDNEGNYEQRNCRWATRSEQIANRRTAADLLTVFGETKSIAAWAKERGLSYQKVWKRLKAGWSAERALAVDVDGRRSGHAR